MEYWSNGVVGRRKEERRGAMEYWSGGARRTARERISSVGTASQ